MKKIVLLLIPGILLLVGVGGYFIYAEHFSKDGHNLIMEQVEKITPKQAVDKFNNKVTDKAKKSEFLFKAPKVTKVAETVAPSINVQTIKLYLDDNIYYPVEVPTESEVITDNSKYIYAKDNTFSVSVVSNVPWDEFSNYVDIKESESILVNLIKSKDGVKGPQEAAMHVANDKAIVVRSYNNPLAFATMLEGLKRNAYKTTSYSGLIGKADVTTQLSKLPTKDNYRISVKHGLGDDIQKIYNYEEGTLTITREFKQWEVAKQVLGAKVAMIVGDNVADSLYSTDKRYYVEKGDYTIGLYYVNYNTTITLFGVGDEARVNILAFLGE